MTWVREAYIRGPEGPQGPPVPQSEINAAVNARLNVVLPPAVEEEVGERLDAEFPSRWDARAATQFPGLWDAQAMAKFPGLWDAQAMAKFPGLWDTQAEEKFDGLWDERADERDTVFAPGPDGRTRIMSEQGHVAIEITENGTTNLSKSDDGAYMKSRDPRVLQGRDDRRTRIIDPDTGAVAFEVDEEGTTRVSRLFVSGQEVAGGGASGALITRVLLLILLGQSNMMGISIPVGGLPDCTHSRRFMWEWSTGTLATATSPLSTQSPANTYYGVGDEISRRFMQQVGEDTAIVVLNAAVGGTSIIASNDTVNGNWALDYTGPRPHLTDIAKAAITSTLARIAERFPLATVDTSLFWHQGEADVADPAEYEAMYQALISEFRTHLGDPAVPWVAGGVVPGRGGAGAETIRQAFIDTAADLEHVAFVDGVENGGGSRGPDDEVHYTREGVHRLADRYMTGWERACYATAESVPHRPLDVTATRLGNEVTVSWSAPICRFTGFTVEWSTDQAAWTSVTRAVPADLHETFTASGAGTDPVYVRITTHNSGASETDALPTAPVLALRG